MKISFRYTLAFCIFLGLIALVTRQVLVAKENNPTISTGTAIFDAINPFWKSPDITTANKNPPTIPVTIENPHENEILVTGKIELEHAGQKLQKIGEIGGNAGSGMLVDYLPVNPENTPIPTKQQAHFDIPWKGFGERYIDATSGQPITVFESLHNTFQEKFTLSFYEKLVSRYNTYPVNATVRLITLDSATDTQAVLDDTTYPVNVGYLTLEKELNTGLIVNFGAILILVLILWKVLSGPSEYENISRKNAEISHAEIEELEAQAQAEIKKISKKKVVKKKLFEKKE